MLRHGLDKPTTDGKYKTRTYILESQKEGQEVQGFAPSTDDLPETHEHYVRHFTEIVNDRELMMVEIGVRPKTVQPAKASDGLNDLDDAGLETSAARAGCDMVAYKKAADDDAKKSTKTRRVKMIREAREKGMVTNAA